MRQNIPSDLRGMLTSRTARSMSDAPKCRVRRPSRMFNSVSATAQPAISGSLPALGLSALVLSTSASLSIRRMD